MKKDYIEELLSGRITIKVFGYENLWKDFKKIIQPFLANNPDGFKWVNVSYWDEYNFIRATDKNSRVISCHRHAKMDTITLKEFIDNYKNKKGERIMQKQEQILSKEMLASLGVKEVIFNDKATIVYLQDGTKGVAKCSDKDVADPQVGFAVAYTIAVGTKGNKKQMKENCDYLAKKRKYTV